MLYSKENVRLGLSCKIDNNRDISYYYVPYYMVPDTLFDVSKSEMNNFLRKNSDDYKQDESRSLNFVYFPLESSSEDSAFYISEIEIDVS